MKLCDRNRAEISLLMELRQQSSGKIIMSAGWTSVKTQQTAEQRFRVRCRSEPVS